MTNQAQQAVLNAITINPPGGYPAGTMAAGAAVQVTPGLANATSNAPQNPSWAPAQTQVAQQGLSPQQLAQYTQAIFPFCNAFHADQHRLLLLR